MLLWNNVVQIENNQEQFSKLKFSKNGVLTSRTSLVTVTIIILYRMIDSRDPGQISNNDDICMRHFSLFPPFFTP
ncbi:hypothetical protein FQR65_LT13856 [Abscondita terminalis]|nr:hypothetical protein FQR65_LT13856 [Abscondita terminalis]